jgi:hypothetical protein
VLLALGVALAAASLGGLLAGSAHAAVPQASSALAVAPRTAAAPAVSLKAAGTAQTGSWLRLSGTVRHARARGTTVVIYRKAGNGWVRLTSARVTAKHRFAAKVRFSKAGARHLRARYRAGGHTARSATLVVHVRAADPLLGDSNSFFGNLLGKVVSGIVSGASGKIGTAAMGEVLSLLGWGDDNDQNAAALAAMDTKLDQIQQSLTTIQTELKSLQSELKITEEEILLNANDPGGAITEIGTYADELSGMSDGVAPGDGDQAGILHFADQVQDDFRIENDVNQIHDAIIPSDSARSPVLDNFTKLAIAQADGGADLNDAYLGLEHYFTQLVYNQMRGVDLVVEAKMAAAAAGLPAGTSAPVYLQQFRATKLAPEVRSFVDNVWRLVLSRVDLESTATFLPPEAESIVSRAQFLSTQILNEDHFGLRLHVVVTDDWAGKLGGSYAASSSGKTYRSQSATTSVVSGPAYDWWSGNTVTPSSHYTVMVVDFGDVAPGSYAVTDGDGARVATVPVQKWDPDYRLDPDAGTIEYGLGICSTRTGAVSAFAQNATRSVWNHPGDRNVTFYGGAADGYIQVNGGAVNDSFTGAREADYTFVLGGARSVTVKIPMYAHCIGAESCSCNALAGGYANATASLTMGVWDATASTDAVPPLTMSQQVFTNGSGNIDRTIDQQVTFTALPGHRYSVYHKAEVDGDSYYGSAAVKLAVVCGKGLEVTFPAP